MKRIRGPECFNGIFQAFYCRCVQLGFIIILILILIHRITEIFPNFLLEETFLDEPLVSKDCFQINDYFFLFKTD